MIAHYEATITQKTARYIKLCDVKAYSFWIRGNFEKAIEYAQDGVSLKSETNVDTDFDCKHNLALAQRDAGHPEIALTYFLQGWDVSDLLESGGGVPAEGPMFGNVGRCLHKMGRLDDALLCYKKSMQMLEKDSSAHSKANRAYARHWVGEIFAQKEEAASAEAFFMDAIRVLGNSAPIRVRQIYAEVEKLRNGNSLVMSEGKATAAVEGWMRA